MKRNQMVAAAQVAVSSDPNWDRIIDQIKGLSPEQQLKMADNIRSNALASLKDRQNKLQGELSHLSVLLASPQPGAPVVPPANSPLPEGATTADKVLTALRRGGNKTVKQLQAEVGTPWINSALSNLIQSKQIVADGKRPAAYSIAR